MGADPTETCMNFAPFTLQSDLLERQGESNLTTATPRGRSGCVDLRATNKPGAQAGSDVFRATQPGRSRRNDPGATSRSDVPRSLRVYLFRRIRVAFCIHMSLLGIGIPHGVLGDIWVRLELKRGD
uniref:Uncharacterized protein n=1 Tax=Brassica oleracea TaxID=3712 RepID=A0A3P6G253_BRAOL|nr:unnamed protein product [Brassica oleracea]